jgi:hypothetical protein
MPSWFAEFARQQEDKFQELMHISEQRNKEIKRLNDDTAGPSRVRSLSWVTMRRNMIYFSQTYRLEHLETGEKTIHALSENLDQDSPTRSTVGCTPYECHVGLKEKNDVGPKGCSEPVSAHVTSRFSHVTSTRRFIRRCIAPEPNPFDINSTQKETQRKKHISSHLQLLL